MSLRLAKVEILRYRYTFVSEILQDCAHGQPAPLIGLVDYLHYDCGYSIERILAVGARVFHIEKPFLVRTILNLGLPRE